MSGGVKGLGYIRISQRDVSCKRSLRMVKYTCWEQR